MKFAYADPPYLCAANLYKDHPDWREYASDAGHANLIRVLQLDYPDGWVLSMASVDLLRLGPWFPVGVRIGAWVKPFASFKPGINPAYCWEPVVFTGGRKRDRAEDTARDWVSASITLEKGLAGAKPKAFCAWVLDLMGFEPGDTFDDLFPGTGIFGKVRDERVAAVQNEPLRLEP